MLCHQWIAQRRTRLVADANEASEHHLKILCAAKWPRKGHSSCPPPRQPDFHDRGKRKATAEGHPVIQVRNGTQQRAENETAECLTITTPSVGYPDGFQGNFLASLAQDKLVAPVKDSGIDVDRQAAERPKLMYEPNARQSGGTGAMGFAAPVFSNAVSLPLVFHIEVAGA